MAVPGGAPTPAVPAVVSGLGIKQYVWQFLSWFADAMEKLGGVTFRWADSGHRPQTRHEAFRRLTA